MAAIEAVFEQARVRLQRPVDAAILRPPPLPNVSDVSHHLAWPTPSDLPHGRPVVDPARPTLNERGLTLGEAYAQYLADPTHAWSRRTKVAHEATRTMVVSVLGKDKPVGEITRADCRDLISVLQRIPRSSSKRFPHLSPRHAADQMGPKCAAADRMSVANINAYLNKFGSFLIWAEMDELISRNPLKGMRLLDTVKKKEKRHPFSASQLQAIFNAPLYRGCQNDGIGYAKQGTDRPKGTRYWVPLLGLFTGMRLNEICQLETTDFVMINRISCLKVSPESPHEGGQKRLKTRSSERIVPLHNVVLDCGFGEFIASRRRAKDRNLFGDLPVDANGFRSTAFSKWFVRFLRQADAAAERTSYHSFRHCFRDALREAQIPREIAHALGGWTTGMNNQDVADVYGGGYSVETLNAAIQKVTYKALDLSHLR